MHKTVQSSVKQKLKAFGLTVFYVISAITLFALAVFIAHHYGDVIFFVLLVGTILWCVWLVLRTIYREVLLKLTMKEKEAEKKMPKLPDTKPCPFCAGKGSLELGAHLPYVYCDSCDARGPECDTALAAIEWWNSRTGDKK